MQTNAAGRRVIQMYLAGTATRAALDNAYYVKGWISDEDYAAVTRPPTEPAPIEEPTDPTAGQ